LAPSWTDSVFLFALDNLDRRKSPTNDPDALTKMSEECRAGTWRSINYRVFHIFPNPSFRISVWTANIGSFWYCNMPRDRQII
jgi:hypothetical protein